MSDTLRVSNLYSSQVGIGTASALTTLHMVAGFGGSAVQPVLGATTNSSLLLMNSSSAYGLNIVGSNTGAIHLQSQYFNGGTSPLAITLNCMGGNVGIGTASPSSNLDIATAARSGTHASGAPLYVTGNIADASSGVEIRHTNGTQGIGIGYNSLYGAGSATNQNVNLMPKGTTGYVGIGTLSPVAKLTVYQDGNSTTNEGNPHSFGILSNQGTSGTNQMYMMLDADYTNQCCSIQSIVMGLKTWNLCLNPRSGNVGVGTTNPNGPLTVNVPTATLGWGIGASAYDGTAAVFGNVSGGTSTVALSFAVNTAQATGYLGCCAPGTAWRNLAYGAWGHYFYTQSATNGSSVGTVGIGSTNFLTTPSFCIAPSGSIGIGTSSPAQILHAYGDGARIRIDSTTTNNSVLELKTGTNISYLFTDQSGNLEIYPYTTSKKILLQPSGGNVGIGTASPSFPLTVYGNGGAYSPGGNNPYIMSPTISVQNTTGYGLVSGWFQSDLICGGAVGSFSDLRIKNNIEPVTNALATIDQLRMVRHGYIDQVENPQPSSFGLIAQEVRAVIPDAVSIVKNYIPNVMCVPQGVTLSGDVIQMTFEQPIDLAVNDQLRFILKDRQVEQTVLFVSDDKLLIRVTAWSNPDPIGDQIFVYGKEVDDFHILDKSKMGLLALAGVKELHQTIKSLQSQLDTVLSRLAAAGL